MELLSITKVLSIIIPPNQHTITNLEDVSVKFHSGIGSRNALLGKVILNDNAIISLSVKFSSTP